MRSSPSYQRLNLIFVITLFCHFALHVETLHSAEAQFEGLATEFESKIAPLVKRYCHECHDNSNAEADINLHEFRSLSQIRKSTDVWLKVRRMLQSQQMPPKDSDQPTEEQKRLLLDWVVNYLTLEAAASAGDPGPVILRRLSNAEYTYTIQDLTEIASLNPTREFPIDGAAGEGFTNTGGALVMSPSLVSKYLDAAKQIAGHMVLLPNGIRFSAGNSRRDHTDKLIGKIKAFYEPFTGPKLDGGELPIDRYVRALLHSRDALRTQSITTSQVARQYKLNDKYLATLWQALQNPNPDSELLRHLQTHWKRATIESAESFIREISAWQKSLWKINSVGHVGRKGGPTSWLAPVSTIVSKQDFAIRLPQSAEGDVVTVSFTSVPYGPTNDHLVVWKKPRLTRVGKPDLFLRDVSGISKRMDAKRTQLLTDTAKYLAAVTKIKAGSQNRTRNAEQKPTIKQLAKDDQLDPRLLRAWCQYLGIGHAKLPIKVSGHFTQKINASNGYDFVKGWGSAATPSVVANASNQQVRIPGIVGPHSVVVHPSPTQFAAIGWQSPIDGIIHVTAEIKDAHPECGNGVEWFLQHRSGQQMAVLAKGEFGTAGSATPAKQSISVNKGDLISLKIGPKDGNHACDLTACQLVLQHATNKTMTWDLAKEVSRDILSGNPRADAMGHADVWHFYHGDMKLADPADSQHAIVPAGSLLATWKSETDPKKQAELAKQIQKLAIGPQPSESEHPDSVLYRQLRSLVISQPDLFLDGIDADPRFNKHKQNQPSASEDLITSVGQTTEFKIPAELTRGGSLTLSAELTKRPDSVSNDAPASGAQLFVRLSKAKPERLSPNAPIVVPQDQRARKSVEDSLQAFRELFPLALCHAKVVPVDEVVTLSLFYREDDQLQRLMLNQQQTQELNQLWNELRFVAQEPIQSVIALEQIYEFSTQDRPDLVVAFEAAKKPVAERAARFRVQQAAAEPSHLAAILEFANRAWRRKLTRIETTRLRDFYHNLRKLELSHEKAMELLLARVLTSPAFLYKHERPSLGDFSTPVSSVELATRLSYFLWSSIPDQELSNVADSGKLLQPESIRQQTERMLNDEKMVRFATHFACQWLHVRDFDQHDQKNEKLYPEFVPLRKDMYRETLLFFENLFRQNGSILSIIDSDETFLNEALAKHYGIDGVEGDDWKRVTGIQKQGRGGVLGMATILASQSGASRTSPILRGNWVSETLLGERLPRPPANVPQLPDSVPSGLTTRQLIEQHSSVAECAKCHAKIDPYGFALEGFDAIGRLRNSKADTKTTLIDGQTIEGIAGLQAYLRTTRRDDFVLQFCRKLLGYSLGREVQLSDEPLIADILKKLKANDYRVHTAIHQIVLSKQFREVRSLKSQP